MELNDYYIDDIQQNIDRHADRGAAFNSNIKDLNNAVGEYVLAPKMYEVEKLEKIKAIAMRIEQQADNYIEKAKGE